MRDLWASHLHLPDAALNQVCDGALVLMRNDSLSAVPRVVFWHHMVDFGIYIYHVIFLFVEAYVDLILLLS
jgi:hypothetical protein